MSDAREAAELVLELFGCASRASSGASFLARLEDADLSISQYRILVRAFRQQDRLTVKDMAAQLSLSPAATSRAVDGLVQRGYLTRDEDGTDRRQRRITLTETGREELAALDRMRIDNLAAFFVQCTPAQRAALADAIRPILADAQSAGTEPTESRVSLSLRPGEWSGART